MPPPLPQPQLDAMTSSGLLRSSDTATLPYPIRQAIATPSSSRHRGDWGLKRALPQRSTSSSTPHLRINAIDNLEHITDFNSAADHTQTLAKWQEMNIKMNPRNSKSTISGTNQGSTVSVFDDELDNTAYSIGSSGERVNVNRMQVSAERAILLRDIGRAAKPRWKTEGPWVAGMSEDDFQRFLTETISDRKTRKEFMEYVKLARIRDKKREHISKVRSANGIDDDTLTTAQLEEAASLKEGEFEEYIARLRDEHTDLSSKLSRLIQEFFDLPPFATDSSDMQGPNNPGIAAKLLSFIGNNAEKGPPATHPSAGLSYIRTSAFMENHPQWGAQASHTPVEARVVRPRVMVTGGGEQARLGIGGFVTNDPVNQGKSFKSQGDAQNLTQRLHPEIEGGAKIWVHPDHAYVNESGRVHIEIAHGDKQAIQVKTGEIDTRADIEASPAGIMDSLRLSRARLDQRLDERVPSNRRFTPAMRNSNIRGFDDDIKAMRQDNDGQAGQAGLREIQALLEKHNKGERDGRQ